MCVYVITIYITINLFDIIGCSQSIDYLIITSSLRQRIPFLCISTYSLLASMGKEDIMCFLVPSEAISTCYMFFLLQISSFKCMFLRCCYQNLSFVLQAVFKPVVVQFYIYWRSNICHVIACRGVPFSAFQHIPCQLVRCNQILCVLLSHHIFYGVCREHLLFKRAFPFSTREKSSRDPGDVV